MEEDTSLTEPMEETGEDLVRSEFESTLIPEELAMEI